MFAIVQGLITHDVQKYHSKPGTNCLFEENVFQEDLSAPDPAAIMMSPVVDPAQFLQEQVLLQSL